MTPSNSKEDLIRLAKADGNDKELLFLQKLQGIDSTLKEIAAKEMHEAPEMPEIPEVDLTETNTLLRQLVDKEDKPQEVRVTLKIT